MVDVDGVLLVHPDERGWTVNLERDIGVSASSLQTDFFERHWDDIIKGRASLRERLASVLRSMSPQVTCDELIGYWFSNDAHINNVLLAELAVLRAGGPEVHLATVQEHERARYLWEELDFRSKFDGLHYAAEFGCSKPDARFYRSIEDRTGFRPHDLFLIDDRIENVKAAMKCGWAAALWTGKDTLQSLIPKS